MEQQNSLNPKKQNNVLSILGALLLAPALLIWGVWIQTFSANPSVPQAEKVKIFLDFFPSFMRSVGTTSIVVLLSSVTAVLVSIPGLRRASAPFKAVGIIAIVVGALVALLQLFSMM